ncbi:hypothetical protein BDK51DRAFT_26753, partial [Blyttiomyces helicus]
ITSPALGLLVDRFGGKPFVLAASLAIVLVAHSLLRYTDVTPFVGMSMFGISLSLSAASNWPIIPHLVGAHQLGTAYGIVSVVGNITLALTPLVVGSLLASTPSGYAKAMTFFVLDSAVAFVMTWGLVFWDFKNGWAMSSRSMDSEDATVPTSPIVTLVTEVETEDQRWDEKLEMTPGKLMVDTSRTTAVEVMEGNMRMRSPLNRNEDG